VRKLVARPYAVRGCAAFLLSTCQCMMRFMLFLNEDVYLVMCVLISNFFMSETLVKEVCIHLN